jgi:hypothetical protein
VSHRARRPPVGDPRRLEVVPGLHNLAIVVAVDELGFRIAEVAVVMLGESPDGAYPSVVLGDSTAATPVPVCRHRQERA